MSKILMIDNYDSFTYNVVHYLRELGEDVLVRHNDQVSVEDIACMAPDRLVISPGPGTPKSAGISVEAIRHFAGRLPILGICLGHQSIAAVFGGRIVRADKVIHGKVSPIVHKGTGVFCGLPTPFQATRYHSLLVAEDSLPDFLEVTAWCEAETGREVMGIRHRRLNIEGVQFHPEAVLSEHGHQLLHNFLKS